MPEYANPSANFANVFSAVQSAKQGWAAQEIEKQRIGQNFQLGQQELDQRNRGLRIEAERLGESKRQFDENKAYQERINDPKYQAERLKALIAFFEADNKAAGMPDGAATVSAQKRAMDAFAQEQAQMAAGYGALTPGGAVASRNPIAGMSAPPALGPQRPQIGGLIGALMGNDKADTVGPAASAIGRFMGAAANDLGRGAIAPFVGADYAGLPGARQGLRDAFNQAVDAAGAVRLPNPGGDLAEALKRAVWPQAYGNISDMIGTLPQGLRRDLTPPWLQGNGLSPDGIPYNISREDLLALLRARLEAGAP
jgi:hypothetical protein